MSRILLTVKRAAPVGDHLRDFAFNMAAFNAAGVLMSIFGASPRWPIATGTRAITTTARPDLALLREFLVDVRQEHGDFEGLAGENLLLQVSSRRSHTR